MGFARRLWRHVAVVGALGVVGCSPFGFEGSATQDAGERDAGSPQGDADVDSGGPSFCARRRREAEVRLCLDFESGTPAPYGFDRLDTSQGGEIQTGVSPGRPGRALRALLAGGSGSRGIRALTSFDGLATTRVRIELEMSLRVESSSGQYAALATLALTGSAAAVFTGPAVYADGTLLGAVPPAPQPTPFAPRAWHDVHVSVDVSPNKVHRLVTIDARTVLDEDASVNGATPSLELQVGAFFTSADAGQSEVWFDDILLRVTPL